MHDGSDRTKDGPGQINWPAIADPMVLLDELERRLDHCETTVSAHLENIQSRLDTLEGDVRSLRNDFGDSQLKSEREVMGLAERLTRLEDKLR